MKVLLPVGGSDYTKRMLSYIAAHNELLGARHGYTLFTRPFLSSPPVPRASCVAARSTTTLPGPGGRSAAPGERVCETAGLAGV